MKNQPQQLLVLAVVFFGAFQAPAKSIQDIVQGAKNYYKSPNTNIVQTLKDASAVNPIGGLQLRVKQGEVRETREWALRTSLRFGESRAAARLRERLVAEAGLQSDLEAVTTQAFIYSHISTAYATREKLVLLAKKLDLLERAQKAQEAAVASGKATAQSYLKTFSSLQAAKKALDEENQKKLGLEFILRSWGVASLAELPSIFIDSGSFLKLLEEARKEAPLESAGSLELKRAAQEIAVKSAETYKIFDHFDVEYGEDVYDYEFKLAINIPLFASNLELRRDQAELEFKKAQYLREADAEKAEALSLQMALREKVNGLDRVRAEYKKWNKKLFKQAGRSGSFTTRLAVKEFEIDLQYQMIEEQNELIIAYIEWLVFSNRLKGASNSIDKLFSRGGA